MQADEKDATVLGVFSFQWMLAESSKYRKQGALNEKFVASCFFLVSVCKTKKDVLRKVEQLINSALDKLIALLASLIQIEYENEYFVAIRNGILYV